MVPSADRPDRLLCAAFALSSTATRASPLRVRGGITRDGALSTGRSAELVGEMGFWWQVVGKGRAHARVRGTPLTERGRRGTGGFGRAAVGSRSHPPSRFPRALRRVCVPPTRIHVPATLAARSCRVWCVPSALGRVRLSPCPPLPTAAFPRPVEIAGAVLPPLPPPRGSRGSVTRGVGLALGGGLFSGEPAVGRVRRVVGRRDTLPHGGLRRLASVSASVLSPVGWRLLGLPGVSVGFGSARCCGRGGTAPGWVQCDSRRFGSRARSPPERPLGPL